MATFTVVSSDRPKRRRTISAGHPHIACDLYLGSRLMYGSHQVARLPAGAIVYSAIVRTDNPRRGRQIRVYVDQL